jgi:flagellar hook-length control protein FliK
MLREEHVKPQTIGITATSFMAYAAKKNRASDSGGAFDELFSRLNNTSVASSAASAASAAVSSAAASAQASSDPVPTGQTPAVLFEQTVAASGTPANKVTMAGSDRSKLEDLLSRSGYQDEDIKQILDQATTSDSSINLGTMFNVMHRYIPSEGPRFFLKTEDKPLLVQALKGLGVGEDDINKFMDGLQVQGGRLVVKGLPSLLAKSGQDKLGKGQEVDKTVLSDLLGKLGLSSGEVASLLEKATDGQDRIQAKAVLAMLQKAANAQDGEVASYLKDLAQRAHLGSGQGAQQNADASKLRAQFIKLFEHIESSVQDQALGFEEALANAAKSAGHKEGKAEEAAFRMVDNSLAEESDTLLDNATAATAQAETRGGMAKGGGQGQGNDPGSAGRATAQTAQTEAGAAPNSTMARLGGTDMGSGGPRATLPTYVVRQVAEQMTQMVAKQQNSLQLALKPPTLGELNMEISVKDGAVKATMVVESVAAKQALEAGMDQLKSQMASQGLKLERVEITINPDAQRQQAQAQEQERFGRGSGNSGGGSRGSAGADQIDLDGIPQASPNRGQSGFISVFA